MKTQDQAKNKVNYPKSPKISSVQKWVMVAMVPVFGFLIACGKSNTNEIDQNNAYQNCSNCSNFTPPGSGNEFLKSTSQDQYGMVQLNLSMMYQLYGTSGFNAATSNYATFVQSYAGLVAAIGNVVFNQNFTMNTSNVVNQNNNTCLIPMGTYTVRTVQAGQWGNAGVSSMRLELAGPAYVTMAIPRGQISTINAATTALNASGRLHGQAVVETINGSPCQIIFNIQ